MPEYLVQTKHPLGKHNKPIDKSVYELFKKSIISALKKEELTHTQLLAKLKKKLKGKFSGNVGWNTMVVKLDLEARKMIERTRTKPETYRLK